VEEVETSTRIANDYECFKFSARNPVARAGAEGGLNDGQREGKKISCFVCRHFFITHEPAHPYGCQAMGFKSRELPSSSVLRSSGKPCLLHVPKDRLESD
jgi:hypothetical protein